MTPDLPSSLHQFLPILLAVVGWLIATRVRFPAAIVLAPMLLVGAASSIGLFQVSFPPLVKTSLQIIVGSYLGYRIDRLAILRVRSLGRPVALITTWMVFSGMLIGYLLTLVTHNDLATAFLGASPGGIAEMSAAAASMQADVILVATLQALRIITTTISIPFFVKVLGVNGKSSPAVDLAPPRINTIAPVRTPALDPPAVSWKPFLYLAFGTAGYTLLSVLNVPAAAIIGSLLAVAAARIAGADFGPLPTWLRTLAQVGLGAMIGTSFNEQTVTELRDQFIPIIAVTAATVSSSLGLAQVMRRWAKTDLQTALLACAPGGVAQMGIIADELGAEVVIVNMFQLTRLVSCILLIPPLTRLLVGA